MQDTKSEIPTITRIILSKKYFIFLILPELYIFKVYIKKYSLKKNIAKIRKNP